MDEALQLVVGVGMAVVGTLLLVSRFRDRVLGTIVQSRTDIGLSSHAGDMRRALVVIGVLLIIGGVSWVVAVA